MVYRINPIGMQPVASATVPFSHSSILGNSSGQFYVPDGNKFYKTFQTLIYGHRWSLTVGVLELQVVFQRPDP